MQIFSTTKPTMSTKRSAATKALTDVPKSQRKMLTMAEKVQLLDILMEGRSYAAPGHHYRINEPLVRSIKEENNNSNYFTVFLKMIIVICQKMFPFLFLKQMPGPANRF